MCIDMHRKIRISMSNNSKLHKHATRNVIQSRPPYDGGAIRASDPDLLPSASATLCALSSAISRLNSASCLSIDVWERLAVLSYLLFDLSDLSKLGTSDC